MANGRRFNPDGHTCAMRPPMPLGTVLRITYRKRSAICTVTDRGPAAWTGNDLDMARAVARALGIFGVAVVTIERM
jgi:rare lipoprotein A (peptidoglycan hydrolase)